MKKSLATLSLATLMSLGAVEFVIDKDHSSVDFKTKHLLVSNVSGSFESFSGKIDLDVASKTLKVFEGEIMINSVNTKNDGRDNHLKSQDFFDASAYPKGYFKMQKQEGDKLYGTLTLRGVSKPVVFDVSVSDMVKNPKSKKDVVALEIEGDIKRKDFGIGSSIPAGVVSDKIKISINLELNK